MTRSPSPTAAIGVSFRYGNIMKPWHDQRVAPGLIGLAALALLSGFSVQKAGAQHQWDTWVFGYGGCIDVGSEEARPLPRSQIETREGSASISDPATGELIFYSDGAGVWNGEHYGLDSDWGPSRPDGILTGETYTTTQAALILPRPGHTGHYYLFALEPSASRLGYSEYDSPLYMTTVDMTTWKKRESPLDSYGRGRVTLWGLVERDLTEKLTAVPHPDGCSYWVIAHRQHTNEFIAWRVTGGGIEERVVTPVGAPVNPAGYLKASPDGTMLAMGSSSLPTYWYRPATQLFRFDARGGVPFDPIEILGDHHTYGLSFSPDSRKLYVSIAVKVGDLLDTVVQYDVSVYDSAAISASRIVIPESIDSLIRMELA